MGLRLTPSLGVLCALLLLGATKIEDGQVHVFPGGVQSGTLGTPLGTQAFRAESGTANTPNPSLRVFFGSGNITGAGPLVQNFNPTLGNDPACPKSASCIIQVSTVCHCNGGTSCVGGAIDSGSGNISAIVVSNSLGGIATQGSAQVIMATQIGNAAIASIALTASNPNIVVTVTGSANFNNTCNFVYAVTSAGV
jgi:hypothetical protein